MLFHKLTKEQNRVYWFIVEGRRASVTIRNVERIHVSATGGHRLMCSDGTGYYVPAGWIAIEFTARDGKPFQFEV